MNILSNSVSVTSIDQQYDQYFKGGDSSFYNQRFGKKKFILSEKFLIQKSLKKIIKKISQANLIDTPITILDYGCGDGRLFELISSLAQKQRFSNLKFLYIGYDPSYEGLASFQEQLKNDRFSQIENNLKFFDDEHKGYLASFHQKNNLEVRLIHGSTTDSAAHITQLIGTNIHQILCMFGVLGHIIGRNKRVEILSMMKKLLIPNYGEALINVITEKYFQKEIQHYKKLQTENSELILDAVEENDIYYLPKKHLSGQQASGLQLFFHVYTKQEIEDDFLNSGFNSSIFKILSFEYPFTLTKSFVREWYDWSVSSLFNSVHYMPSFSSFASLTIKAK